MIPEIGIMLGFFILARLIPATWRIPSIALSVVAFLVAGFVVTDLAIRGTTDRTLASMMARQPTPETSAAPTPTEPSPAPTASPSTASVTRSDGGSITTNLGYGIAVAKDSTLHREWMTIHDSAFPADLDGTVGVTTVYESKQYGGDYKYRANFTIRARASLRAFEVKFLVFNVWGEHVKTLSSEDVVDIAEGAAHTVKSNWQLLSENEVGQHYASIAYVARVRLEDGRIVNASTAVPIAEALKFTDRFTEADLETAPSK